MKPWSALVGLPVSALLGAVLGKLFYVGLLFHKVWPRFGVEALWRLKAAEFSFFGGGLGVILAMRAASSPAVGRVFAMSSCRKPKILS